MNIDPGAAVTAIIAIISAIVWLVRLEGRINTGEKVVADVIKDQEAAAVANGLQFKAITARQDSDATAHNDTTLALVRVQEQLKYLTQIIERSFAPNRAKEPQ